jgi:hypothetical protein
MSYVPNRLAALALALAFSAALAAPTLAQDDANAGGNAGSTVQVGAEATGEDGSTDAATDDSGRRRSGHRRLRCPEAGPRAADSGSSEGTEDDGGSEDTAGSSRSTGGAGTTALPTTGVGAGLAGSAAALAGLGAAGAAALGVRDGGRSALRERLAIDKSRRSPAGGRAPSLSRSSAWLGRSIGGPFVGSFRRREAPDVPVRSQTGTRTSRASSRSNPSRGEAARSPSASSG